MINVVAINGVNDVGTVEVVRCDHNGIIHYNPDGNSNLVNYLKRDGLNRVNFLFDHCESQPVNNKIIKKTDIFVNQISDPDSHSMSLKKSISLYNMTNNDIPWINNPEKVVNTKREIVFTLLHETSGLFVPKTIRVSACETNELYEKIKFENMNFPVLIRPVGSHGGKDLVYIESENDLKNMKRFHEKDGYVSEYIDYKNDDNIYKKYRLVIVAGKVFIRHVIYSDQWKIHSSSRSFMNDNEEYCHLEEKELLDFDKKTAPKIKEAIDAIYNKIGLDYFGIDCAIREGELIIFEINANMNILINNQKKPNVWDEYIEKITNEVVNLILRKTS